MKKILAYISLIVGFLLMIVTGILTDMELITPFSTNYSKIYFAIVMFVAFVFVEIGYHYFPDDQN